MKVKMVGIDHNKASLEYREIFSFTKDEITDAMKKIKSVDFITGNIIISTCNRTELWITVSDKSEGKINPAKLLCMVKGVDYEENREFFTYREDKEAIEHLMITACGINSKVFGEDQIITQIKDALNIARECKCCGKTLEKVFSNSIAAAKKVKTSVKLTSYNPSVADSGVKELKEISGNLEGKNCLIIGNGKMAGLIAEHLVENKANVTMTLRRKYHAGEENDSLVLQGCNMISYDDRYSVLKEADFVISATLSPHYTLEYDKVREVEFKKPGFWLDLAVPRDIDPKIEEYLDVTIYDIDNMGTGNKVDEKNTEIVQAQEIIGTYRDDIVNWIDFRKQVTKIKKIIEITKKDTILRAEKNLKEALSNYENDDKRKEELYDEIENIVESSVGRAVNKLIFGIKDTLEKEYWDIVIEALLESAEKETIKGSKKQ